MYDPAMVMHIVAYYDYAISNHSSLNLLSTPHAMKLQLLLPSYCSSILVHLVAVVYALDSLIVALPITRTLLRLDVVVSANGVHRAPPSVGGSVSDHQVYLR